MQTKTAHLIIAPQSITAKSDRNWGPFIQSKTWHAKSWDSVFDI